MHTTERGSLDDCFGCLTEPTLQGLGERLDQVASLGRLERAALVAGTATALIDTVRRKTSRVLLLELNAERESGTLRAATSEGRWQEFVHRSSTIEFWQSLTGHYPSLLARLRIVVERRCEAALELGLRFAADRPQVAELSGGRADLDRISFGAGDSHRGGRTVAVLGLSDRSVVYKPRSLRIDRALDGLLDVAFAGHDVPDRIRVPSVLTRDGYGWAEFIEHRYCDGDSELLTYYTGLGHWLAMAKLLGATDLHAENLIACGAVPVVIDCETLFSPQPPAPPSGLGDAVDRAAASLAGTVLQSGLLPSRGAALGWRGVDMSAAGALADQQPLGQVPQIIGEGTDTAHLGLGPLPAMTAGNQPSREAQLHRYWPAVLGGFDELTERLGALDRSGALDEPLRDFAGVQMRVVVRATEAYAELSRMLWHPVSLHDEPVAVARAEELLARQGEISAVAPSDRAVIAAEVAELLEGDVPFFQTVPGYGRLLGPAGLEYGEPQDLVEAARQRWRGADLTVEREVIQSTLVSAYLNDGWDSQRSRLPVPDRPRTDLDDRRRRLAADLVRRLLRKAVTGPDGTATWLALAFTATGWSVQPLTSDGYSGMAGAAVVLAGYQHEAARGRALVVPEVPEMLDRVLRTMRLAEQVRERDRAAEFESRPEPSGLYVGLGSQIWTWLRLRELGAVGDEALDRAVALAGLLPRSLAESVEFDVLIGDAGSIIALLQLAELTHDARWLALARSAGDSLVRAATRDGATASWPSGRSSIGLGGLAHGATGIGWALARLGLACGEEPAAYLRTADAAFAYEETLFLPSEGGWRDLRGLRNPMAAAWCHGAVGIGLVSADLLRRGLSGSTDHAGVVRRAARFAWRQGLGWNHTICHGDLGCWELLDTALALGLAPPGLDRDDIAAHILASVEEHGPVSGMAREVFAPGLLSGVGGMIYQLLRLDPACDLSSVLILN